jgi:hypothetical protein
MVEYHSQEMDYLGGSGSFSSPQYVLHKIGPIWGIEQPLQDDPSLWRYFDEKTAHEEWEKLKRIKRDQVTKEKRSHK